MKLVLILVLTFTISAAKVPLSTLIPTCSTKDKNFNDCVVKSANLLIPFLAKGIKEYNFPPIEPLRVPKMDIGQKTGPINLEIKLKDTLHTGLSTMKFHSASIDTTKNVWILNGTLVDYILEGQYIANGRILLVPLVGEGKATFKFKDTGINFVIRGTPEKEKGDVYFKINKLRVYFKFEKIVASLTNLFGGNKELGETTNRFINENSLELVNGMKGTFEDLYSNLYKGLVSRLTSNVPYSQLFKSD